MEPGELKYRTKVLLNYKQRALDDIFTKHKNAVHEKVVELAHRNAELLGVAQHTFLYKGNLYPEHRTRPREINRIIHPDLLPEIIDFFEKDDFGEIEEHNRISTYVSNVFSEARHVQDIQELIPVKVTSMFYHLYPFIEDVINIGPPMDKDELDSFRSANHENYRAFKRLMFDKLLMA